MTTAEYRLPPVLDLNQAAPLKADLLSLRGRPVVVDAADVERLGGLCLQVLLSARETWSQDGQSMSINAASDAFTQQWTAFGADQGALQGDAA